MLLLTHLWRPRPRDKDVELDAHMAGLQNGLDEKRARWQLFLLEKLEAQRTQAQTQPAGAPDNPTQAPVHG